MTRHPCVKGCSFNTPKKSALAKHHQWHDINSEFKCDLCNFSHGSKYRLDCHVENHHIDESSGPDHANTSRTTEEKILSCTEIKSNNKDDHSSSRESSCPDSVGEVVDNITDSIDLDGINERLYDKSSNKDRKNTEYHHCDICKFSFSTKHFLDQHKHNKHDLNDTARSKTVI